MMWGDMATEDEPLQQMYRDLGEALNGLADARFTGTSEDEQVTATANVEGVPVDIELDPRIRRKDSDDIRESLLQAIEAARHAAHSGKEEALRSVFGPDYSLAPPSGTSEMEHTQSMIRTVGQRARQKYLKESREEER